MTDQAEAQAALDAVRERFRNVPRSTIWTAEEAIFAFLENLDARLKALEGE